MPLRGKSAPNFTPNYRLKYLELIQGHKIQIKCAKPPSVVHLFITSCASEEAAACCCEVQPVFGVSKETCQTGCVPAVAAHRPAIKRSR